MLLTYFALFLIIIIVLISIVYLYLLITYNDFNYPELDVKKLLGELSLERKKAKDKHRVLVIYPHPDDETMASGGLIVKLNNHPDFDVKVISLTSGQKGDKLLKLSPEELGKIRTQEFNKALKTLGVKNFEILEFMDGNVKLDYVSIKNKVKETINKYKPDLIVTYNRAGGYGHPDHVALAKMINEISEDNPEIKVLYHTLPLKVFSKVKLPTHMAEEEVKVHEPEYKVSTLRYNFRKYKAAKYHKSQDLNMGGVPVELILAVSIFEYYTTKF